MEDLWRRRVVFESSYYMPPEATGDSEADRIDPADEEEETNRVSAADNDDDDAKSSTNDPLGYYGTDNNHSVGDQADGEEKEVVCSNKKLNPNGVRLVFFGQDDLSCCEDGDEAMASLGINDHKKRAAHDREYTPRPCRMTDTMMRTRTMSSSSSPSRVGSEVVNSYPKQQQQQLNGCTAKRKKVMTEMEKSRLFWDTCLAS